MCGRMCDFGNCCAGRAALPVANVISSVVGAVAFGRIRPPAPAKLKEQHCL